MKIRQKEELIRLRSKGLSYGAVARELGLTYSAVKSYCNRHGLLTKDFENGTAQSVTGICRNCGAVIVQPQNEKRWRFCCAECCQEWWNSHPEEVNRRPTAIYRFTCKLCGTEFEAYGQSKRKYCSHECYISHRFSK